MAYYFIKHIQIYQLYIPTKRVTIHDFYHDTYRDILDKWRYVLWHFVYLCVRRHFFLLRICHIRPWKLKLIFEKKTTIFMYLSKFWFRNKKRYFISLILTVFGTKEIICWNNIANIVRSTQSYRGVNIVRSTQSYRVINIVRDTHCIGDYTVGRSYFVIILLWVDLEFTKISGVHLVICERLIRKGDVFFLIKAFNTF